MLLYADDITLYILGPQAILNPILRECICFGELSGININWSKSQLFPLTPNTPQFALDYPLMWCDSEVKYLGVIISRDREETLRANYGTAVTSITTSISRWISQPLSLAGRITLIKMVILPMLLYLFLTYLTPLDAHSSIHYKLN